MWNNDKKNKRILKKYKMFAIKFIWLICVLIVRVIIELIVQYYNILDGTQYMFIPLSLDECLVQQNLK